MGTRQYLPTGANVPPLAAPTHTPRRAALRAAAPAFCICACHQIGEKGVLERYLEVAGGFVVCTPCR